MSTTNSVSTHSESRVSTYQTYLFSVLHIVCLEVMYWWLMRNALLVHYLFMIDVLCNMILLPVIITILMIIISLTLAYILLYGFFNIILLIISISRWFIFKVSKCWTKCAAFFEIYLWSLSHAKKLIGMMLTFIILIIWYFEATRSSINHFVLNFQNVCIYLLFSWDFMFHGKNLILNRCLLFIILLKISLLHSFLSFS